MSLAGLFPLTGTGWVAVLLFSYNVALVPPCMIISLVFSKVKSASNATSVFTIPVLLSIPLGLVGGFHSTKVFLSILAPIGFSLALGAPEHVYSHRLCSIISLRPFTRRKGGGTRGAGQRTDLGHWYDVPCCISNVDFFVRRPDARLMIAPVGCSESKRW